MEVNQSSRTKNSLLNLLTGLGGQILITVIKFVTRTVFIYTLGKAYLGINGLFADVLAMLSLTELGLDTAINFKLYRPLAEHDDKRVRILMKFYKQAYRIVGIVIAVLGLCLVPLLPFLINDYESLEPLGINATLIFSLYLLQSVTSYLFWAYRSAVIKADQKQYILSVAEYAVTIVTTIVQIAILLVFHNFVLYTATAIASNILKNFINAIIAGRYYPQFFIKESGSLSRKEIIGLVKDCGVLFINKINYVVMTATDNLVLSAFLGLTAVGLYSNYLLFYNTVSGLLWKFYEAIKASMGNLFAQDNVKKKYLFFQAMNFMTVILYGTACAGVSVCADEVIDVWIGKEFIVDKPFAILIGIEIMVLGLKVNLNQIRNVSGAFRQGWYRPILSAVLNIMISVALVGSLGMYGVVVGTIVSSVITNFMIDPAVIHKYSFGGYRSVSVYYRKNLLYLGILVGICAMDMWICSVIRLSSGWMSLLSHIFITGLSVPTVFILLFWHTEECKYLRDVIMSNIIVFFTRWKF